MPTEIDRIHYLLDKFEERSITLNGLSYLTEFLSHIDDIKNGNYDEQNKRIVTNCLLTLKKRIALEINKIMAFLRFFCCSVSSGSRSAESSMTSHFWIFSIFSRASDALSNA